LPAGGIADNSRERKWTFVIRLWHEEAGQDLVEYGLLLVLISLTAAAAMGTLASVISGVFQNASSNLSSS
jgi:Flp pilus assembly pilin Flp